MGSIFRFLAASGLLLSAAVAAAPLPKIGHVFVIVLENQGFGTTFGAHSPAPYLARRLVSQGALLTNYYGIGHYSLDNYIAMISGQPPNPATQDDCGVFSEFVQTGSAPGGQAIGSGCVYPASVQTIAGQLEAAGLDWRAYMEDMGNDPAREAAACGHPRIGLPDPTERAEAADQYASRHNPFVYFHAIIDRPDCARHVVGLTALSADLAGATPNLVFITPNLCHDGHDGGEQGRRCVTGEPGGLISADRFLQQYVPKILASPAFAEDGLLIVTFDEADIDGDDPTRSDAAACCGEEDGPNLAGTGRKAGLVGPGGGRTGAVLLSPFIRPGAVSAVPYNHYALLRSIEDLFGLPHLGYAGAAGLASFGTDIFAGRGT
jgi:hypothetical protein